MPSMTDCWGKNNSCIPTAAFPSSPAAFPTRDEHSQFLNAPGGSGCRPFLSDRRTEAARNAPFLAGNEAFPAGNAAFPAGNAAFAAGNEAFPLGNEALPAGNGIFPVGNAAFPV